MNVVPNRKIEQTTGIAGGVAVVLWMFNAGVRIIDWISRGQTMMTLDPYLHYVVTPAALVLELLGMALLLFYATRLEHVRELDEAPRVVLAYEEPQQPKRHWFWIRIGSSLALVSALGALTVFVATRHHRSPAQSKETTQSVSAQQITLQDGSLTQGSRSALSNPRHEPTTIRHPLVGGGNDETKESVQRSLGEAYGEGERLREVCVRAKKDMSALGDLKRFEAWQRDSTGALFAYGGPHAVQELNGIFIQYEAPGNSPLSDYCWTFIGHVNAFEEAVRTLNVANGK